MSKFQELYEAMSNLGATHIVFNDQKLANLWKEVEGQISDGKWENTPGTDWLWHRTKVLSGPKNVIKVSGNWLAKKKNYDLVSLMKHPVVKERMMKLLKTDDEEVLKQSLLIIKNMIANPELDEKMEESNMPWERENFHLKGPEQTHSIGYGFYGKEKGVPLFRKVGDKFEKISASEKDQRLLFKSYDKPGDEEELLSQMKAQKAGALPVGPGHERVAAVRGQEVHVGSDIASPEMKIAMDHFFKGIAGLDLPQHIVKAAIEAIVDKYKKKD